MEEDKDSRFREIVKVGKLFISPAGALIVLICFFLPWAKISCQGLPDTAVTFSASDTDIARIMWAAFAAVIVILVAYVGVVIAVHFGSDKEFGDYGKLLMTVVIVCWLVGVASIIIRGLQLLNDSTYKAFKDSLDIDLLYGAWATLAGFVLILGGAYFLKWRKDWPLKESARRRKPRPVKRKKEPPPQDDSDDQPWWL